MDRLLKWQCVIIQSVYRWFGRVGEFCSSDWNEMNETLIIHVEVILYTNNFIHLKLVQFRDFHENSQKFMEAALCEAV
jgi:hypothetical protein